MLTPLLLNQRPQAELILTAPMQEVTDVALYANASAPLRRTTS